VGGDRTQDSGFVFVGDGGPVKFVDQVRVHAKAGDGGDGCCSFRREKFVPRGGPDGGDGGDGGDIILEADPNTDNLASLYFDPKIRAKRGAHGQGKNKHGRNAAPTITRVPVGTLVYSLAEDHALNAPDETAEPDAPPPGRAASKLDLRALEPIADLAEPGGRFLLCAGGHGGKGNTHFKSSLNRAPRRTTEGRPGEEGWFALELRTIADAGLVGFPNAGKSTLLGAISAARPKVASYPFTTLNPIVGIVELPGYRRATVADIPGLIEGAHENRGLGHEFLRHIVRCRILLFVVDLAGTDGRDPLDDFRALRREIKLYDPTLEKRPHAVIANKIDVPGAEERLSEFRRAVKKARVVPVSARDGTGVDAVVELLGEVVGGDA
jgi:GTPase